MRADEAGICAPLGSPSRGGDMLRVISVLADAGSLVERRDSRGNITLGPNPSGSRHAEQNDSRTTFLDR
jgi:hypothetical protein